MTNEKNVSQFKSQQRKNPPKGQLFAYNKVLKIENFNIVATPKFPKNISTWLTEPLGFKTHGQR